MTDKNIVYCDNDKSKQNNVNVFSPEEAVERFEKGLFIKTSVYRHEEMHYQLRSCGVEENDIVFYVPENALFRYEMLEMIRRITPLAELQFEVHIADHCNLNCQNCTHFSPLSDEAFTEYAEFEKDMKRLSFLFDGHAKRIFLIGGEPLLNPEISKYMRCTREAFPDAAISVFTNGLLLEKMGDEFWEECRESSIQILITKYPLGEGVYEKMEEKCQRESVVYSFVGNTFVREYSRHDPFDLEGKQDAREMFLHCGAANDCIALRNGRLYTCVTAAYAEIFNKYFNQNLEITEDDGIDIYEANNKNEILSFLCKPIPFCRFCKVLERTCGYQWRKSEKKIEEWT